MLETPILVLLRKIINENFGSIKYILVTDSMWDDLYEELKSLETADKWNRWTRRCHENGLIVKNISIVPSGTHTPYSLPRVVRL